MFRKLSLGIAVGRVVAVLGLMLATAAPAYAQLDRVYSVSGSSVTGKITDMKPDGLVIAVGSTTQPFRLDEIKKFTLEGDPGPLTRGRDLALEGQYQSALDQLKTIDIAGLKREYIAADATFYQAFCMARLALSGQGDKKAAENALTEFAGRFRQNVHVYEAAELLGDLAVSNGDYEGATRYYGVLGRSSAPMMKVRSVYLLAVAALRQGKADAALADFDKIIGANIESAAAIRLKNMARTGKAVATAKLGQGQAALEQANELVSTLSPDDSELAARAYNARGAANEALGDSEAALLDYLHTHLLFSNVADAHAEALSRMVALWPKVGQPEKATAARQELQSRYPGWGG